MGGKKSRHAHAGEAPAAPAPPPAAAAPAAPAPAAAAPAAPAPMAGEFALKAHPTIPKHDGPVLVCILDGFGENEFKDEYNAVHSADTPTVDALKAVPGRFRSVKAHGTAVGLPSDADMGNSEVGHNALGAGQIINQGASLVDAALANGKLFEGDGWKIITPAFASHTVHFIGLLSDGGVHSRCDQLYLCIKGAAERGAKRIRVHVLTDGRDVPDGSSLKFLAELEEVLAATGVDAKVASGGGRMLTTMDRYEVSPGEARSSRMHAIKGLERPNWLPGVFCRSAARPIGRIGVRPATPISPSRRLTGTS